MENFEITKILKTVDPNIMKKLSIDGITGKLLIDNQPVGSNVDLTTYLKIIDADNKYELKDYTIVKDVNYVHTDNNYTTVEKNQIANLQTELNNRYTKLETLSTTEINTLVNSIVKGMNWKDSVNLLADLPITGNNISDTRVVIETSHIYIWNGTTWIDLGGSANIPMASSTLDGQMSKEDKAKLDLIIVANLVTVTDLNSALANKVDKVTGKSLVDDTEITKLSAITGSNTGDETQSTIKSKLGSASASSDGYLTSTDWNNFNNKTQVNDSSNASSKDTYSINKIMSLLSNKQNKIIVSNTQPADLTIDNFWLNVSSVPYLLFRSNGTSYNQVGGTSSGGSTSVNTWVNGSTYTTNSLVIYNAKLYQVLNNVSNSTITPDLDSTNFLALNVTVIGGENIGTGAKIFNKVNTTNNNLQFKTIVAGNGVNIVENLDSIAISAGINAETTTGLDYKESLKDNFTFDNTKVEFVGEYDKLIDTSTGIIDTTTNIALNKTVTSNSQWSQSAGYERTNLTNGILGTTDSTGVSFFWDNTGVTQLGTDWAQIALGNTFTLGRVGFNFRSRTADSNDVCFKDVKLEFSDGTSQTVTLTNRTSATAGVNIGSNVEYITITPVKTSYIKITPLTYYSTGGTLYRGIAEFIANQIVYGYNLTDVALNQTVTASSQWTSSAGYEKDKLVNGVLDTDGTTNKSFYWADTTATNMNAGSLWAQVTFSTSQTLGRVGFNFRATAQDAWLKDVKLIFSDGSSQTITLSNRTGTGTTGINVAGNVEYIIIKPVATTFVKIQPLTTYNTGWVNIGIGEFIANTANYSYDTTQYYTVEQKDISKFNSQYWSLLTNFKVNSFEPTGTYVKWLVKTSTGVKKFDGTNWVSSSISNIATDGMTSNQLTTALNNYNWGLGDSFSLVHALKTDNALLTPYVDSVTWTVLQSANKKAGHTIEDSTQSYTDRPNLQFKGTGVVVTDDPTNNATVVTINSGSGNSLNYATNEW